MLLWGPITKIELAKFKFKVFLDHSKTGLQQIFPAAVWYKPHSKKKTYLNGNAPHTIKLWCLNEQSLTLSTTRQCLTAQEVYSDRWGNVSSQRVNTQNLNIAPCGIQCILNKFQLINPLFNLSGQCRSLY